MSPITAPGSLRLASTTIASPGSTASSAISSSLWEPCTAAGGAACCARAAAGNTLNATPAANTLNRSEEHTSELQSLMRISYAVFCLQKKKKHTKTNTKQY